VAELLTIKVVRSAIDVSSFPRICRSDRGPRGDETIRPAVHLHRTVFDFRCTKTQDTP